MSYSCSDFTDSILDALKIEVPDELADSPSDQADLALEEIGRLEKCRAFVEQMARMKTGSEMETLVEVAREEQEIPADEEVTDDDALVAASDDLLCGEVIAFWDMIREARKILGQGDATNCITDGKC